MLHDWPGHVHVCLSLLIWHEGTPPNAIFGAPLLFSEIGFCVASCSYIL